MNARTRRRRDPLRSVRSLGLHGGKLDLHVHVPTSLHIHDPEPDHAIDATSAATDACVAARLDAFFAALKSLVGIDRGTVTFHPIDASFVEVETCAALDDLYRQSRSVPDGQALHFMFTNDLGGGQSWACRGQSATRRRGTARRSRASPSPSTHPIRRPAMA